MYESKLIEAYIPWIERVTRATIRKAGLQNFTASDFYADAAIGLLEARKRFDSSRGKSFEQFAYPRVRGAVLDAVRRESPLSTRGYKKIKELQDIENNNDLPDVVRDLGSGKGLLAFKLEYSEDSTLLKAGEPDPEESLAAKQSKQIISILLESLSLEQRRVIRDYYFAERSLSEIAREQGGTRSQTSRLHLKALERLKKLWQLQYDDSTITRRQRPAVCYAA
jgi:RNA polymerase sigma factor for flagellar operon FliA